MFVNRNSRSFITVILGVLACLFVCVAFAPARAQTLDFQRQQGLEVLQEVKKDIRKYYYDPTFRGKDLDAHFKAAEEKINQAPTIGHMFAIIVQSLIDFNDSHTYFILPRPSSQIEHGWRAQMIGDHLYVVAVKPKSDAEAQGMRPGDKIVSFSRSTPTRDPQWLMSYSYHLMGDAPTRTLSIEKPDGTQHQLTIAAAVKKGKQVMNLSSASGTDLFNLIREGENEAHLNRHRYYEVSDQAVIWKMPNFNLDESQIDDLMDKTSKRNALVLDLRGNGGGSVAILQRLIGNVFDHEIKIGDLKRRTESKPLIAKTRKDKVFQGKLIVLIDSESGSAAEVFARVIQLEKRGTVIGDRSAGAVMISMPHRHQSGVRVGRGFYYGVNVTDADIIMTDGKSLERWGVKPDELLLPTSADLAAGRDPVLSRAAVLAGIKLSPEDAGALFKIEWRK